MLVIFPFGLYGQSSLDFRPESFGIVSLNEPWKRNNIPLNDKIYYYLTQNNKSSVRYTQVDSISKKFIIGQKISNYDIRIPQIIDIDNLMKNRFKISNREILLFRFIKNTSEKIQQTRGFQRRGVGFSIPMPAKSKMLQNLIGSDINLNVNGSVSIKGNLIQREQSTVKTNINQASDYTFKLEQTQKFNINGNIGKLAKMNIDQDSQRQFDYLNVVNLNYNGKEDDIVQEVHAGNIALSLPGTRFVTFSGNSQGLFGLKSSLKVGDFKFTSIASLEKGQKQKLSLKGGAQASSHIIKDYEYTKGIYFFVDDYYREHFKYNDDKTLLLFTPEQGQRVITDIEVWKAGRNYHLKSEARAGWALFDADINKPGGLDYDTTGVEDQNNRRGNFIRLEQNKDYFVNKDFGYIVMNQRLTNEILAVSYIDVGKKQQGTLIPKPGQPLVLKMIRNDSPHPSDKVWPLEWKNVYNLGGRNIDPTGLEINIIDNRSGTREKLDPNGINYLEIFNLDRLTETGDRRSDDKVDINNSNLFNFFRGELIFPSKRPFAPEGENSDLPENKWNKSIYDELFVNQAKYAEVSQFDIEVKSTSASASYNLGFNLLPGSEDITLGGQPLVKGKDYEIDYNTGRLQILKEQALKPGADLDIKFENGEMFQLDKKTIMGMRSEYNFASNGFIGFTGMMLSERILEQRVKLDQEPIKNVVWDVNTKFSLEPNFITTALDLLPIIDTNAPSTFSFEGEVGQVMPNPNTISVGSTGDDDGVADLDNFEGSSLFTTINIGRKGWVRSSVPFFDEQSSGDPTMQYRYDKRGKLIWYNPWEQVQIKDIFPNKDVNTRTGTMTNILVLKRIADKNYTEPSIYDWWSGVTTPLSTSYYNQTETKYIEIWVKGNRGKVHLDMGLISEDAVPNGVLNTEDIAGGMANGILDLGEDVGLDGIPGTDGTAGTGETFDDDWAYTFRSDDYEKINGTEGNGTSNKVDGLLIPDTEDINRNGILDTRNDYFEYTFTLGRENPDYDSLVVGGEDNEKGWLLYKIPIDRISKKIGNPDITRIEFARIWVEGLDVEDEIQIASINLAGNDWKEVGITSSDITADLDSATFGKKAETIFISVINTEENAAEYESPPGVFGLEDRITGAKQREQSLVFKFANILPGQAAAINKSFMREQNAIHYKELKMFVHGDDNISILPDSTSDLMLFFRFGRDENSYFEVRQYIFPEWNEIRVPLDKLSTLEFDFPETKAGYPEWGGGKYYRMAGNPTSREIRVITVGILNKNSTFTKSGEIWLDELRVSSVEKVKGIAMRTSANLNFADLGGIAGNMERRDADFHNVNERWGSGGNTFNYNIQSNVDLGRVISSERVFSIPIAFTKGLNRSKPKYLTGKDILLESLSGDSLTSALTEREINKQENSSFNFSFTKNVPSMNWFLKNTIDKISFSYASTSSLLKDYNTEFNKSFTANMNFGYSQTFDVDKFGLSPFGWIGEERFLVSKLSGIKFILLPNKFNFNASTAEKNTSSKLRGGIEKPVESFGLSKNFSLGFTPINNLTLDFNRSSSSDMRDVKNKLSMFAGNFGEELSMSQKITSSYQLRLFSWLTNRFNYNADYSLNNNIQLPEAGKSATNKSIRQGDLTINLGQMLGFQESRSSTRTAAKSSVRIRRPVIKGKEEGEKEKKEEKEEGEKKRFFLIRGIGALINKISPITVKYSQNTNATSVGLEEKPGLNYQFGFDADPGVETKANVGTSQGSVSNNNNISASSGFNLTNNIKSTINFTNNSNSTERANTFSGDKSQTYYISGDKKIPFFNWNVSWGGIEKFFLLKPFFRTISFSHAYTGTKATQLQTVEEEYTPVSETYTSGFKPFAGVTFNWKNGMASRFTWNIGETINDNLKVQTSSKTVQENISFTSTYSKTGGFSLPLPFLSSRRVSNSVNFKLSFLSNKNATFNSNEQGEYIKFSEHTDWSFKPEITYSFSSKINGGLHFELGKTKDKLSGERSTKDFGLSVDIIIAGR